MELSFSVIKSEKFPLVHKLYIPNITDRRVTTHTYENKLSASVTKAQPIVSFYSFSCVNECL